MSFFQSFLSNGKHTGVENCPFFLFSRFVGGEGVTGEYDKDEII